MDEETDRENQGSQVFGDFEVGLQKQLAEFGRGVLRNYERDRNDGPVRRDGQVFYRLSEAIPILFSAVSFSRPLYRSSGSPSFSPVDESLSLFDNYLTGERSALMLLCHCVPTDGAEIFERLGGPVVELLQASV